MASKDHPQLKVFRGFGNPGAFTWSPFSVKLEARLRFDSIPYSVGGGSPKSAPRGKIPYVEFGDAQQQQPPMGDSTFIIKKLIQDGILTDLNGGLSPADKARDLAVRALMEERVSFYGTREKWCDNFYTMRANALAPIPWPLQVLVGLVVYQTVTRTLHGQGTGRFTDEEVAVLREEAWESVGALLAEARRTSRGTREGPFWVLGGEAPTEADATLFGFVASALTCEAAPATGKIVRKYPAIMDKADEVGSVS
ncbi:hypothetical protein ACJ41O_003234 [Fusarium nematophilum]